MSNGNAPRRSTIRIAWAVIRHTVMVGLVLVPLLFWVRGYEYEDFIYYSRYGTPGNWVFVVGSATGRVALWASHDPAGPRGFGAHSRPPHDPGFPPGGFLGFQTGQTAGGHFITIPAAFVVVLAALPLIGWHAVDAVQYFRLQNRYERGQCIGCGYDLRASIGNCPECGRPR